MDGVNLIQTSQERQGAVLPTVGYQALPDSALPADITAGRALLNSALLQGHG